MVMYNDPAEMAEMSHHSANFFQSEPFTKIRVIIVIVGWATERHL